MIRIMMKGQTYRIKLDVISTEAVETISMVSLPSFCIFDWWVDPHERLHFLFIYLIKLHLNGHS